MGMTNNVVVGIDIGYGFSKVVGERSTEIFPSLVGPATVQDFVLKKKVESPGETVTFKDKQYFVGEKTRHSSVRYTIQRRDWITSDMYGVLLSSAILRIMPTVAIDRVSLVIVTGLPVDYYSKDKQKAAERVREACNALRVGITHVDIIPQPFGTFFDILFTDHGEFAETYSNGITVEDLRCKRLGVVDIGYHTTDYIIVEDNKHYIAQASGSIPAGMHRIYSMISKNLQDMFDKDKVTTEDAENAVRTGIFESAGKMYDIRTTMVNTLVAVGDMLAGEIRNKWAAYGDVDTVLLSGGGAELLKHYLNELSYSVKTVGHAQMANARGYYKRALALSRNMPRICSD